MNAKSYAFACLTLLIFPEAGFAHSPIQGIGNFYNGLLHPVLVPSHLLLVIAVGLFFGQQGPKTIQPALGAFALATIAGLAGAWFSVGIDAEILLLSVSVVVGLIVAISPKIALLWSVLLALVAGFLLGIDSAQEELSGKDKLVTLFGTGIAIYLLVLYPMALADHLTKKEWQRIGIRIVGSWVAASSLLVIALSFAPQNQV